MSRLTIVPVLIGGVLVAVAIVVVLFGASPVDGPASVEALLAKLESGAGGGIAGGGLFPEDRDYWQAVEALSRRLAEKRRHLTPEDIETTARRLVSILEVLGPESSVDAAGVRQRSFAMMALARLETASAVAPLARFLDAPQAGTRIGALRALAQMHRVPEVGQALGEVLGLLEDGSAEVELVACVAVAALAERGDAAAIEALAAKLESGREIQWNAAMTLARLGSTRGKLVLMNLLERSYWEGVELDYVEAERLIRRKYTNLEVSNYLAAAIEAASHLDDADLAQLIRELRGDESHVVREAARAACGRMERRMSSMRDRRRGDSQTYELKHNHLWHRRLAGAAQAGRLCHKSLGRHSKRPESASRNC